MEDETKGAPEEQADGAEVDDLAGALGDGPRPGKIYPLDAIPASRLGQGYGTQKMGRYAVHPFLVGRRVGA